MSKAPHLVVESGVDKGVEIVVTAEGIRLGRSSKNDVILNDPQLSRHHCRLFFREGGLWVTDLGSANETKVNDRAVTESPLKKGDRLTLGDTIVRVLADRDAPEAQPPAAPLVDLGLKTAKPAAPARGRHALLILVGTLVTILALVVWLPRLLPGGDRARRHRTPPPPPDMTLEVQYEKVQATAENIFRYCVTIDPERRISAVITDLKNKKHLVREPKGLDAEYARSLAASLRDCGFFALSDDYSGVQPDVVESYDIAITVGRRAHRVRVVNRVEPESFRVARDKIEKCAENELGLAAIPYSTEKLTQMASDAFLLGRKLYDEREVQYGNLAAAIRAFKEAEWHMESLEPKPDFYGKLLAGLRDCESELQQKYEDQNFRAARAIQLREWNQAATELRILLEMVPDGADPRHEDARKKLLDVESHLATKKK